MLADAILRRAKRKDEISGEKNDEKIKYFDGYQFVCSFFDRVRR